MGAAIVHLKWTPAQFWAATMHEYQSACEIIEKMNRAAEEKRPHGK